MNWRAREIKSFVSRLQDTVLEVSLPDIVLGEHFMSNSWRRMLTFGGQGVVSARFLRQCRADEFQHYRDTSLWITSLPFIVFLPVFCTRPETSFKNWRTVLLRRQVVTERTATAGGYGRSWYALEFVLRRICR